MIQDVFGPTRWTMIEDAKAGDPAALAAANNLETSPGSVRNRLHRGKRKVAEYLDQEVARYAATPQEHQTEIEVLNAILGRED